MNDSQQIPSVLKEYVESNGLEIDHNFLLTYSRYQTNLLLSFIGLGLFFITIFVNIIVTPLFIIAAGIASIILSVTIIPLFWSAFISIRMLYIKKNWFPVQNQQTNLDMDYKDIMGIQGKNLKTILFSYLFAFLWLGFVFVSNKWFNYDIANLYPFSFILYLVGMLIILIKSLNRYQKSKTIMHISI